MRFISIAVLALLTISQAHAHGGGLDKQGCHHNRKVGGYHCHRGAKDNPTAQKELTGLARIVDGDTIWIGMTKIRLHGIDAPEMRQECVGRDGASYRCGDASTDSLHVLVGSEPVRCEGDTYDRYKRLIAVCYSGTVNLNAELVRLGWALAYRRYSKEYISAEKEAKAAKRGMWAGTFNKPWEWRRN
jgi:endonuclease YncB( thermonuclease family)